MDIGFESIEKKYGEKTIVKDFTLLFESGTILCLMGPSGAGKTTLLNIFAGLTPITHGRIIGAADKKISYIFQEPRLLPFMTVYENIALVMKEPDPKTVEDLIELMELTDSTSLYPDELSGGMQQRVSFARALAYKPDILLADEPGRGLDINLKKTLYEIMRIYAKQHDISVIMVTHEPSDCVTYADEVVVLSKPPMQILYRQKIGPNDDRDAVMKCTLEHL